MGFKNFVRAGASGIMYDFFQYQGKDGKEKVTGPYVVLKLLETLPRKQRYRVVFEHTFMPCLEGTWLFMYCNPSL